MTVQASDKPIVVLKRTCDKCGYELTYTHEDTRPEHRDADGDPVGPVGPVGTYLDCPRQSCRHDNRVPDLVAAVPKAPIVVQAAPPPRNALVELGKEDEEDPDAVDCSCVVSVAVASTGPVFYDKIQSRLFARRPIGETVRAYFAKVGCDKCGGLGRVAS